MEETHQDGQPWPWPPSVSQLDDNITLLGEDPHNEHLVLKEVSFLEFIAQHNDQSLRTSSDTESPFDLCSSNNASFLLPPTQESTDSWTNTAYIPLASFEFSSANNLGHDQVLLWYPNNGPCNNSLTEDRIPNPPSKWVGVDPNEVHGNFPEISNTEPQDLRLWDSLFNRSPYSESQGPSSWDSSSSQYPCLDSHLSPGFSEPFNTPPAISGTPVEREIMMEQLNSPTGDYIPGSFPSELVRTVSPIPEPCHNKSHNQQSPPSRLKARDRRKKELPVKCPVPTCQKGHQYKNLMERHIRAWHEDYAVLNGLTKGPSICKLCGKCYTRSDRLYRHGRLKHGWPPRKKKSRS